METSKPNIIFFMTDQQRWDCIGRFNQKHQDADA
jgi:arylsulfatase A-like enzyme